jgi:hypothetical protein
LENMKITREVLIYICDRFIDEEIFVDHVQDFAWNALNSDSMYWDEEDDVINETLEEWDNEAKFYEIKKENMVLWKKILMSEVKKI